MSGGHTYSIIIRRWIFTRRAGLSFLFWTPTYLDPWRNASKNKKQQFQILYALCVALWSSDDDLPDGTCRLSSVFPPKKPTILLGAGAAVIMVKTDPQGRWSAAAASQAPKVAVLRNAWRNNKRRTRQKTTRKQPSGDGGGGKQNSNNKKEKGELRATALGK